MMSARPITAEIGRLELIPFPQAIKSGLIDQSPINQA